MLMFRLQTAEHGFSRITPCEEPLSEAPNPMVVVNLRQMAPHNLTPGERVQEPVQQQDVLGAQLADVAVGAQKEVVLVVEAARRGRKALEAGARVGVRKLRGRALEVGEEGEEVVGTGLQGLQRLQQDRTHLLQYNNTITVPDMDTRDAEPEPSPFCWNRSQTSWSAPAQNSKNPTN